MTFPIRVGLIGLGQTTADLVPGGWGAKARVPYLLSSPKYQLVAICNSSVQSAKDSIAFHNLSPEIKAYGSAEDLAKDPNVDLIAISVKIAQHYELTKPALLAGKDVFAEWPLGKTAAEAEELLKLAEEKGARTIVGAQGRASAIVNKSKEFISTGQIGKVVSTTVVGSFSPMPHHIWPQGAEYYLDKDSGGNTLTIHFGHFLDSFTYVLGDLDSLKSILKTNYPTIDIIDSLAEVVTPNHAKTSPGHISIIGSLTSGATASLTWRTISGKPMDDLSTRWIITGTDGELEITAPEVQWQNTPDSRTVLKARLGKGNEAQIVDFKVEEVNAVRERLDNARNTARLYEAFADREEGKFQDFGSALELHRLLERIRGAAGVEWKIV